MDASHRPAEGKVRSNLLKLPVTANPGISSSPVAVRLRLPRPPTSFLGRDREVAGIRDVVLSGHVRLLTLVGPPGVGKTRLALAAADEIQGEFADGALFIDLSPVRDPALVAHAIAQTLHVTASDQPVLRRLMQFLQDRHLLLVLDNFEHVPAAAGAVGELLAACGDLKILATSREPLHLDWEREFPVPPLAVPDLVKLPPLNDLSRLPAVALFVDRARAVLPDFALTAASAQAIAEICVRLDGLPLAIEMAAARVKAFPPHVIASRLDRRLSLLTTGARNVPDRHQTLRAAFAWSYDLLPPADGALFRRLSVFQRGWTGEAALEVSGDPGEDAPAFLDRLASIVDKSLLWQHTAVDGTPRFFMLESLREFGLERLEAAGELKGIRRRHATYFLELADRADSRLRGPEQETWFSRLEAEVGNFRAALGWMLESGEVEPAARLAYALHWFWYLQGYHPEARTWLARILGVGDRLPTVVRGRALTAQGMFIWTQGDHDTARRLLEEAAEMFRASPGARRDLAWALHFYGHVRETQRDASGAAAAMEESVILYRDVSDDWGASLSLNCLGRPTILVGDPKRSIQLIEEAQAGFRRTGDRRMLAHNLRPLADVLIESGENARAMPLIEESIALCRQHSDRFGLVTALVVRAKAMLRQGQYERALMPCKEALILARDMGLAEEVMWTLTVLARVAISLGQGERAARLLGASSAVQLKELVADLKRLSEETSAAARLALGEEVFETARRIGKALAPEEAVDEALSIEPPLAERAVRAFGPLSPRERDVAALVAQGLSNREIGRALFIGHRTVETHIQNILNKLGFDRRSQIAAWAASHGLSGPHS